MSVSRLRRITWIVSILLTAGLGWYVYDIVKVFSESGNVTDTDEVKRVLQDVELVSGPSRTLVDHQLVKASFYDFDWTGKPPPVVVEIPDVEPKDTGIVYTPVAEILSVYYLQEDTAHPERSRAYIRYTSDSSGVTSEASINGSVITPGDILETPHTNVSVESITIAKGVTFQFDDAERPHESLGVEELGELVIPLVDSDSAVRPGVMSIPRSSRSVAWRPPQTTQIGRDSYQIGSEDAADLGENYAHYLANEVRHRRHRDPQTGKFDGIEIQSVTSGSLASRHGAAEGDVIRSINGHPVTSVSEAITFVKNHEDEYSVWDVVISNRGVDRTVTYYSPSDG